MRSTVESLIAIKHGFDQNREVFEQQRIDRIRKRDIVTDYPAFDEAFRSAKYLGNKKPTTGLTLLRELFTKMDR
ncbi:MAG: hypothetical protein ABIR33_10760 [Pyrinomonadaceae bacterium]